MNNVKRFACITWCMVFFLQSASGQNKLTFYKDIRPIIFKNCVSCHRQGQSAPFPLVTYNDVVKHATTIKYATGTGYMPPWKADTAYRKFADQRILTAAEIESIAHWIENGAPAGDAPAGDTPTFNTHSNIGRPDLILTASEKFTVPGNNQDTVAYFVMHYSIPCDTNVVAFEFVPGDPRAVHHSNTWVFPEESEYDRFYPEQQEGVIPAPLLLVPEPSVYDMLMQAFIPDPVPAREGFQYPEFFPKRQPLYYDGWVPGASARTWPPGFGFRLPSRGIVIMQLHYGPTPIERHDQSSVNIFFTDKTVTHMIESFNIGSGGGIAEPEPKLTLPPDSVKSFVVTTEITRDLSYLALNPHMHYLGKEMKAFAITPANDTIPLVWIKQWDFKWQEFYKPLSIIKIPQGSILKIFATFDNTATNPANRFNPPREVQGGSNSTDEMMSLIIMSTDYQPGDEQILLRSDAPVFSTANKQMLR